MPSSGYLVVADSDEVIAVSLGQLLVIVNGVQHILLDIGPAPTPYRL